MVNKPKKNIVRQQSSSEDHVKRRSGKPKGIKQNKLPLTGEWCEHEHSKQLVIQLTIIGRSNNLHKTGTQSKQQDKSEQRTKQKNQISKKLADICGRFQKSDGTIVFFFNTRCEEQNLAEIFQETDLYEINKTLIEKLGQIIELRFFKEMINFIKRADDPFYILQEGGLESQHQVVQAFFVKSFLDNNKNDTADDVFIQNEFAEFKKNVDQNNIIKVYENLAEYFQKQYNQYENESNQFIEPKSYYEDQLDHGQQFQE